MRSGQSLGIGAVGYRRFLGNTVSRYGNRGIGSRKSLAVWLYYHAVSLYSPDRTPTALTKYRQMDSLFTGNMEVQKQLPILEQPKPPKVGIRVMLDADDEQLLREIAGASQLGFSYTVRQIVKAGLDAVTK